MRREIQHVLEFVQTVDAETSVDRLTQTTQAALQPLGVTSVSTNLIMTPGRVVRAGMLFGHHWKDWSNHYVRSGYQRADPAVRMLRAQTRPFSWSEARTRYGSSAAERVMDACFDFTGSSEGFVVPIRESDGSILTAALSGPDIDLSPDGKQALHLAGYYYATRGREILQDIGLDPACPLTSRQLECLQWVQAGKTDREIGTLLGISACTVHNHIETAKRALGTTKRSQAAFAAWGKGWIG